MAQNIPITRKYTDLQGFTKGVNSFLDPQFIDDQQVRWAENAVNKGGVWQTRPGFKSHWTGCLTQGTEFYSWWIGAGQPLIHPQFFTVFTPTGGDACIVFGISGTVFTCKFNPDGSIGDSSVIQGLSFDPAAPQIAWASTIKSTDIVSGKVMNVPPRAVLMLQDGNSRAGYWDGVGAGHLNPQNLWTVDSAGNTIFASGFNQTRIGLWMAWSGNRLWVARGNQVFYSDLGDPLNFTECTILTNVPQFSFVSPVTGMIDRGASGIQQSLLFVFTADATYTLWSGIQQSSQWISTGDFQRTVFNGVGCVAGKSPINHMGLLHWYSAGGAVAFDSLGTVTSTQALPPIDSEMAYSKRRMSPDKSLICAGYRDSYVLWSVPMGPTANNGRAYNNHTQSLDKVTVPIHVSSGSVEIGGVASWQGVWTGIRPVEWATATVFGQIRCFCLSMDFDSNVRIWEAFQGNRCDNGKQISWTIETKSNPVTDNPFVQAILRHFRILFEQIQGNLTINGFWKGLRGHYHFLLNTSVTATPGSVLLNTPEYFPVTNTTESQSFAKQFRDIFSQDSRRPETNCQSTGVEAPYNDGRDRAFSLFLQMKGVGAIMAYRLATDAIPEDTEGMVMDAETGLHILPENIITGCPEFIPGDVPDFTIPDSPLANAFAPWQSRFFDAQYVSPVAPFLKIVATTDYSIGNLDGNVDAALRYSCTGTITLQWTMVSGPGNAVFDNPNSVSTHWEVDVGGLYVFRITATDGEITASSDISILIESLTVDAGPDQVVTGLSATMAGSVDYSGRGPLAISWSQKAGPGTVTFVDISSPTSDINADTPGEYLFVLDATDGVIDSESSVRITFGMCAPPEINTDTTPPGGTPVETDMTFFIVATGSTLTYQWEFSTNGGSTWSDLSDGSLGAHSTVTGATTDTVNFSSDTVDHANSDYGGFEVRCFVSNGCGDATSTAATIIPLD